MPQTITLEDGWLGRRTIETTPIAVVTDQHKLLCAYRDDGRVPSQELLDDIAAYESILGADDPVGRAKEYMAEHERNRAAYRRRMRPREIARKHGWMP